MTGYHFILDCYPTDDLRSADIAAFAELLGDAFGEDEWEDAAGQQLHSRFSVESSVLAKAATMGEWGLVWLAKSKGARPPIVISVAVGGRRRALSYFKADFSGRAEFPSQAFFRTAIEQVAPYQARLFPLRNEVRICDLMRGNRRAMQSQVSGIGWLHYLSSEVADQVGGEKVLLSMPAFRVERFFHGVLVQLTEKPIDPEDDGGLAAQLAAMEYLGLISRPRE